jgi:hypothetical protein
MTGTAVRRRPDCHVPEATRARVVAIAIARCVPRRKQERSCERGRQTPGGGGSMVGSGVDRRDRLMPHGVPRDVRPTMGSPCAGARCGVHDRVRPYAHTSRPDAVAGWSAGVPVYRRRRAGLPFAQATLRTRRQFGSGAGWLTPVGVGIEPGCRPTGRVRAVASPSALGPVRPTAVPADRAARESRRVVVDVVRARVLAEIGARSCRGWASRCRFA